MKKIIEQIHQLAFKIATQAAKKEYKDISDDDVDKLAESVQLLNDVYEELFDKVFDDSESICKNTSN